MTVSAELPWCGCSLGAKMPAKQCSRRVTRTAPIGHRIHKAGLPGASQEAARYLSRQAEEQKYTVRPSMSFVTDVSAETYVPHTGSFFSSPPGETVGAGRAGLAATWELIPPKMDLRTLRTSQNTNNGTTTKRNNRRMAIRGALSGAPQSLSHSRH